MHCLRARVITIMMLMSIACINWSVAGSGSARRAMADHASVKVIMALLRRTTVFCNHLPQWLYHQVHQVLSDSNSLTFCSNLLMRSSSSVTRSLTVLGGDLERPAGTHGSPPMKSR